MVLSSLEKWHKMLAVWDVFRKKKASKLKSRIRKGIPDSLRAEVWYAITNAGDMKSRYPNDFYTALSLRDDDCPNHEVIQVDLNRTFPRIQMFMEQEGRDTLQRVLRAYAFFDIEVGYCQGMGFIAGTLLIYLEEEKAFWVFVCLLRNYGLKQQFAPGMVGLHRQFFVAENLLRKFMPKSAAHLKAVNMEISFSAAPWFMTIFSNSLPFECVVRVWDSYLNEGPKVTYRVFLALFKLMKTRLKKLDFEQVADLIKETLRTVEPDVLMNTAFKFRLSRKLLATINKKYEPIRR